MRHNGDTIGDVIGVFAKSAPDSPAIVAHDRAPLTYGALQDVIKTTCGTFSDWGISRDDRVALFCETRAEALVAFLAIANAAIVVPINTDATVAEWSESLIAAGATFAVVSSKMESAAALATELGLLVIRLSANDVAGSFSLETANRGLPTPMEPPSGGDIAAILMSSGTTSAPKLIPLSHELITYRGRMEAEELAMTPADIGINFRPSHLNSALNGGLIIPLSAGSCVSVLDTFSADNFFRDLARQRVTWYTGGPVHHEAILERAPDYADIIGRSRLRFIRSASYSLAPKLMAELERTFNAPCLERYGGTESGLISHNPLPPARRKPGTAGHPTGCEIRLRTSDGEQPPQGEIGEILVKGRSVFAGYDIGSTSVPSAFDGEWFGTGDLGRIDADGYLTVCGRLKEEINRGGRKVNPNEVETALMSHPSIFDCICFPAPHSTLGQIVAAAVAPAPGAEPTIEDIRAFLHGNLSRYKIPDVILLRDVMPRGSGGKLQRLQAAEIFGLADPIGASDTPATTLGQARKRSPLELSLAAIWCDILKLDDIGDDDEFVLSGGDSLRAMQLLEAVEQAYGVVLTPDAFFEDAKTLRMMAEMIAASRATNSIPARSTPSIGAAEPTFAPNSKKDDTPVAAPNIPTTSHRLVLFEKIRKATTDWPGTHLGGQLPLHGLNLQGTRPPLFWCFNAAHEPGALAEALGPDQPLFAMRSLNFVLGDKQSRWDLSPTLGEAYCDEIAAAAPLDDYTIGGNCQSGRIAESLARKILRDGGRLNALMCLEYAPETAFDGRVALFFGDQSVSHNPFLTEDSPEKRWLETFKSVSWDIIPGDHGQYFSDQNVSEFAGRLRMRMNTTIAAQ